MKSLFAFCLFFLCGIAPLTAQKASPVKFLIGGAVELGGDRVGTVTTEENGLQLVRGAQGVSIATGVRLRFPSFERFMLDATVGYKYWRTLTPDANVRLTRIPLHLTGHYWLNDNFRVGAGVLTNRNIRFSADGLGEDGRFDPSYGMKLELGWRNLALGYTRMYYNRPDDRARCAGGIGLTYLTTF